jgi:transglutaminase-like putative cysteine protease
MIKTSKELADYARPSFSLSRQLYTCVEELTRRIFQDFTYTPGFTNIATPLSEVLAHKKGVCQDFAHLQVGCLRAMGIPAKYVSGYMETLPPLGQKRLVGADATHAWIAYYSPQEGWIEFDPTNNVRAGIQHIVTAEGRDYYDVTPLKGVIFGGGKSPILEVSVDVARKPEGFINRSMTQ